MFSSEIRILALPIGCDFYLYNLLYKSLVSYHNLTINSISLTQSKNQLELSFMFICFT